MNMNIETFEELWKEQQLCDAVLKVDDTEFKIHKVVLAGCSSYFKTLFTVWSGRDDQVYDIANVSADVMKIILNFAYTGIITPTQETKLDDLFLAADCYDIPGICQLCCKVMESRLSPQTCIRPWNLTNTFYYPDFQHKVFSYILKHFEEVVARSDDFLHLSVEDLCKIIENDKLNVRQENTVFEAILKWIAYSTDERKKYLPQLLQHVRLALTHPGYFSGRVLCNDMVKENPDCHAIMVKTVNLKLQLKKWDTNASLCHIRLARPRLPQGVLMAIGGWKNGHPTNIIETYDCRTNRWWGIANNDETPRASHGTVYFNGSVYLIGGFDGLEDLCTTHKYDLVNHTWQEVAPMHWRRSSVSVALLDGLIYAIGGSDGVEELETAERYTPQNNQWTVIASMNRARRDASSTTFDGKIYIFGGFDGEQCMASVEVYNPSTNQWTIITRMSCRRRGVRVIAYSNEIYAVGGFDGVINLNFVEAYNPQTNSWRHVAPMLQNRSSFGIEVLDDRLFVVGGFNASVESFDVKTGLWSEVRNMGSSRASLSCSVVYDLPNIADYVTPYFAPPRK